VLKLKVLIVDDNTKLVGIISEYLRRNDDIEVVGTRAGWGTRY
jgi:chemotaxis response regulator CheB